MPLFHGDSLHLYKDWDAPTVIISDGPYGISGYEGDLNNACDLAQWYYPHIRSWREKSTPTTTLFFWNTEVGWAEVHSTLQLHGWIYRSCNIWNKGIAHIAGNSNTKTLRRFPVVTEVCAHYVRAPKFELDGQSGLSAQEWLRSEWQRTGLPFNKANDACGVKNAASRKYLTPDHRWYFPPPEVFERLVAYANAYGNPSGKPYFSIDGKNILTGSQWKQFRGKFYCPPAITNVWDCPAVRSPERIKDEQGKTMHPNQKPLALADLVICASSDEGDVVWEPFGGLFTFSLSAERNGRTPFAAEIDEKFYEIGKKRFIQ